MKACTYVHCKEASGKNGCFLAQEDRMAISPVFEELSQLFDWMHQNGWKQHEYEGDTYVPWQVERTYSDGC
jgi:hypothetical protein